MTSGTTTSVLVGLLGFLGGGLLSYSAYDRGAISRALGKAAPDPAPKPDDKPRLDLRLAGIGMTALSLTLLVGLIGGMWFRYTDPFGWVPAPAAASQSADPAKKPEPGAKESKGTLGLQGSEQVRNKCETIADNLRSDKYRGGEGANMAIRDLREMVGFLECAP